MHRVKVILQLLPFVRWELHDDWMNTYVKNFILKQCFKSIRIFKLTTPEQRVDLFTSEIDFLKELTPAFLIPHLKVDGVTFTAPKRGLTDLSIQELAEADTRLSRYLISERQNYLHTFIACLYDDGLELTEDTIDIKARSLAKVSESDKVSIIRSFLGSRKLITAQFPEIFPTSSEPTKPLNTNRPPKVQDTGPMWDALIQELANTKGYQGMDTAKCANAWEALGYLNREMEKNRKQHEKLAKA